MARVQKLFRLVQAYHCPIRRPFPILRPFHHAGPHRVEDYVASYRQEPLLILNKEGLEPSLEDMTYPLVAPVEILRIYPVQLAHSPGKVGLLCS